MKSFITLAAVVACFLASDSNAQFLPQDACDYAQGWDGRWMHNTGTVLNLVRDPARPAQSFYTVAHNAICYVEDAFAEPISFNKVLTSEEVGYAIRDIAVSRTGAMAVTVENKRLWWALEKDWVPHMGHTDDQMILFRPNDTAEFYEIKEIGDADMGRIEDVWLNGASTTLVAVSATKVGTWERSGDGWTNVNLTTFSDIGIADFPSLHEFRPGPDENGQEWSCSPEGYGMQIVGHPDGDKILVDAHRVAYGGGLYPCGDTEGNSILYYAFIIESSTDSWDWTEPIFVRDSWCSVDIDREEWGSLWEVQSVPHDPTTLWASCAKGKSGVFALHTGSAWSRVEAPEFPFAVAAGGPRQIFYASPTRAGHLYIFSAYRFAHLRYTADGGMSLVEGSARKDRVLGSGIPGRFLVMESSRGIAYFEWSPLEEYRPAHARIYGGVLRVSDLAVRKAGEVVEACVTRSRDMLVTLSRNHKAFVSEGSSPRRVLVGFWETDGYRAVRLLRSVVTPDTGWSSGWEVRCEPSAYMGDILVRHARRNGRVLRFSIHTLKVVRNDPYTPEDYFRALYIDPAGGEDGALTCRSYTNDGTLIEWGVFRPGRMEDYPLEASCGDRGRVEYRVGDGIVWMNAHGVHWADPRDGPEAFWYTRVTVSDHDAWQSVGLCGSLEAPAAMFWRAGMMPTCTDIAIPSQIARHEVGDPSTLSLSNYPNPFLSATNLTFGLAQHGVVTLEIYDINGRRVSQLDIGVMSPGAHALQWDGGQMSSGVYMVRLVVDGVQVGDAHRLVRI
ncbi:MAG: T9SS type A sorting domain-containing protein [Bacteroidetes bacterium]|nr:T9SS type A sorting domain-containing protein [Bacteroidota bacterium]